MKGQGCPFHNINMAETDVAQVSGKMEQNEDFKQVNKRKSRKRKMEEDTGDVVAAMDTIDTAPKRPNLPEISSEKLVVSCHVVFT